MGITDSEKIACDRQTDRQWTDFNNARLGFRQAGYASVADEPRSSSCLKEPKHTWMYHHVPKLKQTR